MAKTMLLKSGLSKGFWTEAVNNAYYISKPYFPKANTQKIPPMNYGKEGNPTFLISIYLDLNVIFLTLRTNYQSLILNLILVYS